MSYAANEAAEAAMKAAYKDLKERFVSGLSGGTIGEINCVTAVAPVALMLWSALQARKSFFKPYGFLPFCVDFLLNIGAILLATTLYANTPILLILLLAAPVAVIYAIPKPIHQKKPKVPPPKEKKEDDLNPLPKKPFLTIYRGSMMIVTCIAILAVDFRIFPRRFAKVETWGTSLMDVGVGSFVFAAGIVAARPILKERMAGTSTPFLARLYRSIRHSAPLLLMGFIRLYSVKGLDYAEHVTEYGVHWNFFFTLGFLPPFVAIFQTLFQFIPSYAGLSIILGGTYQLLLKFTSLDAYILTSPRTTLLSQNREGIFSFLGYLAIFLAGQSTGMFLLPRKLPSSPTSSTTTSTTIPTSPFQQRKFLLITLTIWSLIWTLLYNYTTSLKYGLNLTVSRRLANLPYFLWISSFNSTQILLFLSIETVFFPQVYKSSVSHTTTPKEDVENYKFATSRILEAYNRNGLAIFLAANLLTGLVNLTLPTLYLNDVMAMGILIVYMSLLTGLAVGLDAWGVDIKL